MSNKWINVQLWLQPNLIAVTIDFHDAAFNGASSRAATIELDFGRLWLGWRAVDSIDLPNRHCEEDRISSEVVRNTVRNFFGASTYIKE